MKSNKVSSYLQYFVPLDSDSVKFLIGNPGSALRSIVWNAGKGGLILVVGSTTYTLVTPKLALADTEALIKLHEAHKVPLDYDKIQELHRQCTAHYEKNDIFKALKFEVSIDSNQHSTSTIVRTVMDKPTS